MDADACHRSFVFVPDEDDNHHEETCLCLPELNACIRIVNPNSYSSACMHAWTKWHCVSLRKKIENDGVVIINGRFKEKIN